MKEIAPRECPPPCKMIVYEKLYFKEYTRCGSRIWSRGAPGSEAESCRCSEAESREQSEQFAAGVQDLLKGLGRFWVFNAQICILPHSRYKARHAHKRLYTVLPKYSKIQVLPGITSCRLMKYNKQAIELNSLLINNMPEDGYE